MGSHRCFFAKFICIFFSFCFIFLRWYSILRYRIAWTSYRMDAKCDEILTKLKCSHYHEVKFPLFQFNAVNWKKAIQWLSHDSSFNFDEKTLFVFKILRTDIFYVEVLCNLDDGFYSTVEVWTCTRVAGDWQMFRKTLRWDPRNRKTNT